MECFEVGHKKLVALILVLLLVFSGGMVFNQILASPGASDEVLIEPHSYVTEASYVVFRDGSDFKMRNGTSGEIDWGSTDDDAVLQASVDNATVNGGSVYVKSAVYSASVTLKDNVTLWFERGVSGITVSIDSGADCALIDEENGFRKEYVSGSLYSFMDYRTGEFWYGSENRTDLIVNPTSTASYIVESDGTNTWMTNCSTGQRDWTSTNSSAVINSALGNLTSGRTWSETVYLKGNFTINAPIQVPSYVDLAINGKITLADGSDCNMIENADRVGGNSEMVIRGVEWAVLDGNQAEQTTGNGIDIFNNNVLVSGSTIRIEDLRVLNWKVDGVVVDLNAGNGFYIRHVYSFFEVGSGARYAFRLFGSDSFLMDCAAQSYSENLYLGKAGAYCADLFVSNCYFGGASNEIQVRIVGVSRARFEFCTFDNCYERMIYIDYAYDNPIAYSKYIDFIGCFIHTQWDATYPSADNTFDAVVITGNSHHIKFIGGYIGQKLPHLASTNKWRYGIYEAVGTDYTSVRGVTFDCNTTWGTAPVYLVGSNSKVFGCQGFVTENSGTSSNSVNGTLVTHGLAGTPDVVTLTISGSNYINSTCFLIQPSVIATNSTHFQVGFYFYMNTTAIYPVTTVEQRDVYWSSEYKP